MRSLSESEQAHDRWLRAQRTEARADAEAAIAFRAEALAWLKAIEPEVVNLKAILLHDRLPQLRALIASAEPGGGQDGHSE